MKLVDELCCGCSACEHSCPSKCIEMNQNNEGFYTAYLDESKCLNCNLCRNVCPLKNYKSKGNTVLACYAAASEKAEFYNQSSSGGVFSHVARYVLMQKGVVFGCGFDEKLHPIHKMITRVEDIDLLRRSKYVQSNLANCFLKVRDYLLKDIEVLFVGTPCQVSGLKLFLGKEYSKLMTIDLICHGTPSPQMFTDNISWIETKTNKKVSKYEFRLKSKEARKYQSYSYYYEFDDGTKKVAPYFEDPFFNEFYDMTSLNECCYKCPYSSDRRPGDLTIGDYEWGKKYHAEFSKFDEISCILVNTEKGKSVLAKIEDLHIEETAIEHIKEKNLNLIRPTLRPTYRNDIYREIREMGYIAWADKYFNSIRYYKKKPPLKWLVKLKICLNRIGK